GRTAAGGGSRRRRRVPRQRAPADPRRRQSDIRRAGRHGHADPSGPDAPGRLQPEEAARLRQANRGRATVTTLRGSTSDFPLESLIGLLAGTSKTGELQVRSNDRVGALGFASGRLVAAVMDDERDVTAIAEQLRVGRMDTLTLLAGLVRDGVIETIAPPSGFAPSRNAPPPEAPAPQAPAEDATRAQQEWPEEQHGAAAPGAAEWSAPAEPPVAETPAAPDWGAAEAAAEEPAPEPPAPVE